MDGRRRAELLEVVRVLLLAQAAILVASTVEAFVFGLAFSGGLTPTVVMTAGSALAVLVSRARLSTEDTRGRRALAIVEGVVVISLAVDTALALFLTHQPVPLVAILTRFVLPVAVLALLARTRAATAMRPAMPMNEVA